MIKVIAGKIDFRKVGLTHTGIDPPSMHKIGAFARNTIIKRLDRGLGLNNNPMRPYSEAYRLRREKAGKQTDVVNLEWSAKMRNSIRPVDAGVNRVYLSVGHHRKAAYYTDRDRKWWGLDRNAEREVQGLVNRYLGRKL